jgi:glycerate 2-kinase
MIRFDRTRLRAGFGRMPVVDLLERGLLAVDPRHCVREALSYDAGRLRVGSAAHDIAGRRVWAIAVGKAAVPMAETASQQLGSALTGGVAVTRYDHGGPVRGVAVLEAGHPIPDENGMRAARAINELANDVEPDDLVVCLLSGGGSALLSAPPEGVCLDDLAATTRLLLGSGAPIEEINAVRRHLSSLQGGRLARRLGSATVITLALSDVVGDRPETIASGPTVPDPTTFDDAIAVLQRRRLWRQLPPSVQVHLRDGAAGEIAETPKPGDPAFRRTAFEIVGNNDTFLAALERAAQGDACHVVRSPDPVIGEARDVGRELARRAAVLANKRARRTLLAAGGETTVTVRGRGRGGRNQELALAAALEIDGIDGVCIGALATDGSDGSTDAAGAVVDGTTAARARQAGIDPAAALADNDSHAVLDASNDLLVTGPTRTNVADVYIAFIDAG